MQTSENTSVAMPKNDKKIVNAWCSYDWANSVYNLIVTTAIFPIYYSAATKAAFGSEIVSFFGWEVKNTVIYTYAISFSFLVIVLLSPILSGIADYSGKKKRFMQLFTTLGAAACLGLFFFKGSNLEYGLMCAVLASIGYAGALVFYNGFLPEIATPDRADAISARGFSMGYIGSVILLVINLVMITQFALFGFEDETAPTQIAFLMVGIWWIGFAQIAFKYLKDRPTGHRITNEILGKGFRELRHIWLLLQTRIFTLRFLFSFFFYSMGVQTVMLLAPLFGENEIGMGSSEMILIVLILQLLAIAGAYFFAWLSDKRGNKFAITIAIFIWIGICSTAFFLHDKTTFYILAGVLGFVMGGIQSISRSTYAKMIPEGEKDTASYFSFFDVTEKLAIVIGTFSYGFIEQLTGSMRNSILAMSVFFVIGLFFLLTTKMPKVVAK